VLGALKAWWIILVQVGPLGLVGRQADLWIRFFIAQALDKDGLFDYVNEPRDYGQIVARFGYVDSPYTREVLDTLALGRDRLLIKQGRRYQRNPAVPLPERDAIARRTPKALHSMTIFRDFAHRIPSRMRQAPIDFVHRFEEEGPALFSFDRSLSVKIYAALRRAAFQFVSMDEIRGKRVLDVGCGSGHETADLWVKLGGDAQITAVDPVPGLLSLADENFEEYVNGSNGRELPPVTETNRPEFRVMSAMNLDFPDHSFDVVYHSLILHWLPDPQRGIREIARVLKPGGLVFGTQITRPMASPYMNLIIQVHESVNGFFWEEEFNHWYEQSGVNIAVATPAGIFRGYKVLG
jgi:ubiquinone/menaquinone biosynthesis C-methylase UbiE